MSDILSSLSIILVFVTIALDIFIKEAEDFSSKSKPDSSQNKLLNKYNRTKSTLISKLSAVTFFYLLIFYLLLPNTIKIIDNSNFSFWKFDLVNTFYVIINFGLFILFIIALLKTYKLIKS